jgi:hypothetical protein
MTNFSRVALIAAVAAMGLASPAFAQMQRVAVHHVRHHTSAGTQTGSNAFAMVPSFQGGNAFSPSSTGGGSVGYNENLRKDTW